MDARHAEYGPRGTTVINVYLMKKGNCSIQHLLNWRAYGIRLVRREISIKHDIQAILHDKDNQKYFQEAIITQRNNRYVIPVKQEYRQYFDGLIHDRSATGSNIIY